MTAAATHDAFVYFGFYIFNENSMCDPLVNVAAYILKFKIVSIFAIVWWNYNDFFAVSIKLLTSTCIRWTNTKHMILAILLSW